MGQEPDVGRKPRAGELRVRYRSDIDGLRAVAVVPVVIFHVAQSFLRGGYVGVDIFFVISGYLISAYVFAELDAGRFSLARFYERRIRRILPAYFAVLVFVTAVVLVKFLPTEAASYGRSLAAAVASATNVYFWETTGYFALAAEEMPLLHTWSLAVEEQFYLVFPLLMILLHRHARRWTVPAIGVLLALSLALSIPGASLYPSATFYLLPTRAWELLLGSVLAAGILPPPRAQGLRDALGALGLVLIAAAMVLYTAETPFPGLAALPPCLGAALILYAGQGGPYLVGRLLSLPPLVFVGLISYSLYLWHWPLLAFQRTDLLLTTSESKLVARAAVLAAAFACATLSWWLIERPTRDRARMPSRVLLPVIGVAAAGCTGFAIALTAMQGFPARYAPETVALGRYLDYDPVAPFREGRCFLPDGASFASFDPAACAPDAPGRRTELLIGDSHAAALYAGLHHALPEVNLIQASGVRCAPMVVRQPDAGPAWAGLIDYATNRLPAVRRIDRVWLAARWNRGEPGWTNAYNDDWMQDLLRTAEIFRAKGIAVVVVGPMPEYREPLPRLLAKAVERADPGLPQRMLATGSLDLDRAMAAFARANRLTYVSPAAILCANGRCTEYAKPGVPLLFDRTHLTQAGSDLLAEALLAQLKPAY